MSDPVQAHTLVYAGFLFVQAFIFLFAAAFFVRTWASQRAKSDYLLFAIATLAVSAHTATMGAGYYALAFGGFGQQYADMATYTAVASLTFILHFGVRYAELPQERRLMPLVYAGAVFVIVLIASDNWWAELPAVHEPLPFGPPIVALKMRLTSIGTTHLLLTPLHLGFVAYLFGRKFWAGRREGGVAFAGAVLLALAGINDTVGLSAGLYSTVSLAPFAYALFIYGVSLVLVQRYNRASLALERSTAELRQRTEELHHSVEELERTQEELVKREQLAAIGGLASVIADEVRSPLVTVNEAVRALHDTDAGDDDAFELLTTIKNEMRHLERMVNDLLHFARPIQLQKTQVDLRSVVRASSYVAEDISKIEVTIRSDGPWPSVMGDVHLLRQAFECLTINAAQAMGGRGEIGVTLERSDVRGADGVAIVFTDAGEGMTEQQRAKALAPFFTTRPGGTGLGLPICARIIEAHGGNMTVDSRVGEGTTVTMFLPLEPDDVLRQSASWQRVSLA